jgi:hypothetical protein
VSIVLGFIIAAGSTRPDIALHSFLWILGMLIVAVGIGMLNPGGTRRFLDYIFFSRDMDFQITMIWLAGALRAAIGAALIYAITPQPDAVRNP